MFSNDDKNYWIKLNNIVTLLNNIFTFDLFYYFINIIILGGLAALWKLNHHIEDAAEKIPIFCDSMW